MSRDGLPVKPTIHRARASPMKHGVQLASPTPERAIQLPSTEVPRPRVRYVIVTPRGYRAADNPGMTAPARILPAPAVLGPILSYCRRHAVLIGVVGYLVLATLRYSAIWQGGNVIVGGPPDNGQHAWELAWWAFALTHGANPLTTNYLSAGNHPINLMWNNSTALLAVLALPITLLASGLAAFNLLMVATLWASTSISFLCLRHFTDRPLAAWSAGLLFGLSPAVTVDASSGRLPWVSLFFLPVFLLLYIQLVVRREGRRWLLGLALGLSLAGQLMLSEELTADLVLVAVVMTVLLGITHRDQLLPTVRFASPVLIAAIVVALLVAGYPLYVQFFGPGHVHGGVVALGRVVSDLAGFVVPTPYQVLNLGAAFPTFDSLQTSLGISGSYLGLPVLAILVFMGIRQWRDPATRWALVLVLVAMVLSLGPQLIVLGHPTGLPLPWAVLKHVPLLRLAAPRRLMVFAYLGAAVVLVRLAQLEWADFPSWLKLVSVAACLITLAPVSAVLTTANVPPFFSGRAIMAMRPGSLAILAPTGTYPRSGTATLAQDMIWQADSGFRFRMVWGDLIQPSGSGHAVLIPKSPLGAELYRLEQGSEPPLTPTKIAQLRSYLLSTGADYVLLGPSSARRAILRLFEQILDQRPATAGGVYLWVIHR